MKYESFNEFTNDLNKIFPWPNFFNGTMENYLKGDEYVGGCFGYETRYPFCDKFVVQEFLWLKPELKNTYKNSIYNFATYSSFLHSLCYFCSSSISSLASGGLRITGWVA